MRRGLIAVMGALLGLAVVAPAVQAGNGGPTTVTTDKAKYNVGETVIISATGFTACVGAQITFTLDPPGVFPTQILNAVVNGSGQAQVNFVAPNRPGAWKVDATAPGCESADTKFNIAPPIYPPGQGPKVKANQSSFPPGGGSGVLSASGFAACAEEPITFTITPPGGGEATVLNSTLDEFGNASVNFPVATSPMGTYNVTAQASDCGTAVTAFDVAVLPSTGSDSRQPMWMAAIAIGLGMAMMTVGWRRRRPAVA